MDRRRYYTIPSISGCGFYRYATANAGTINKKSPKYSACAPLKTNLVVCRRVSAVSRRRLHAMMQSKEEIFI
jgi:hypothetical protein